MLSRVDFHSRQSTRKLGEAGARFGIARLTTNPKVAMTRMAEMMALRSPRVAKIPAVSVPISIARNVPDSSSALPPTSSVSCKTSGRMPFFAPAKYGILPEEQCRQQDRDVVQHEAEA